MCQRIHVSFLSLGRVLLGHALKEIELTLLFYGLGHVWHPTKVLLLVLPDISQSLWRERKFSTFDLALNHVIVGKIGGLNHDVRGVNPWSTL